MKILVITNQLLTTCGVSKHLFYFLSAIKYRTDLEITILSGGGDAIESYRNLCKEIIIRPYFQHEKRSTINFIKAIIFLYKLVKKNKYEIIHSHNHYADNIAKFISSFLKIKTIQTVHGIIPPKGRLNHYPSNYLIAVNEHVYEHLIKINKKKSKLIRSGLPIPSNCKEKLVNKIIIVSAGRLIFEKGFDIYIDAISKLKENILSITKFYIAGKGEKESYLKEYALQKKVNVNFIGEVKNLYSLLEKSHIFVLSSFSEGFPLVLIEAALNKNLVISSNFFGHDSILLDNINSLIFDVNDSDELAKKIEYAVENYNKLNWLIENLYSKAVEEFNMVKMIDKTISFYNEILEK